MRQHLKFEVSGDTLVMTNLGTTSRVFVNSGPMTLPSHALTDGDQITVSAIHDATIYRDRDS